MEFFSQNNYQLQLKLYKDLDCSMRETEKFCGVYAFTEMRSCTNTLFSPPVLEKHCITFLEEKAICFVGAFFIY